MGVHFLKDTHQDCFLMISEDGCKCGKIIKMHHHLTVIYCLFLSFASFVQLPL